MVLEGCGGCELVPADLDLPGLRWRGWRSLGQGWAMGQEVSLSHLGVFQLEMSTGIQLPPGEGWTGGAGCSLGPSEEGAEKG